MMKKIYNFFLRIETLNRAAFVMMLSVFFVGQVWGDTFTIDCTTSSSDELFSVTGNGTKYDYDSKWTSYNLIKMNQGDVITIVNVNGATISKIEAEGVADDNSNKTVNLVISDGTTSAQTSSGNWNNRKSSSSLTNKEFSNSNVKKLKFGEGQVYTITNMTTSSYDAGVRFVITYTPGAIKTKVCLKPNANWKAQHESVDPRFAVYYWKSSDDTDNAWLSMTEGCGSVYTASIPEGYDKCIFCRMKGNNLTNDWSNKINQTGDLTVPTGKAIYYTVPESAGDEGDDTYWGAKPFEVCVTGTWLAFSGETITLNATCPGATNFQWYKGGMTEGDKIEGATSATYTKTSCTIEDGGNYYCKAWREAGSEKFSGPYGVRVPRLIIQTPGSGSDRKDTAFTRGSTSDEAATCEVYLGVAWTYEFAVYDGIDYYGNTGTMYSTDCSNWTMFGSTWCKIETTKEGTYTFNLTFSNSTYTPLKMSVVYPPMAQTPGINLYMENTPAMQERGWNNGSIYYRIGKGKYDKGDSRNWTSVQKMDLVPGTARYLKTTTPSWATDFWAWHVANNKGDADTKSAIYRTYSDDGFAITESSNFSGDKIASDMTIYLNSTSGGYGKDAMNNNCQFYGYTSTPGMLTHKVTVKKTTHGTIRVEWTDVNGDPQTDEGYSERDINNLAHTCILTITGVPESCRYKLKSLKVNSNSFTSGTTFILTADATITAEFEEQSFSVNLHINGGTINSGNVTKYTHEKGAILPTDVTKGTESFGGWYGNSSLTGMPVTEISADECGNKEFWAKWGSPCEFQPIITKVSPTFTIWDGKLVDAAIANLSCNFDTTGIKYSLKSATPAISCCSFIYSNNQIHLVGTPTVGNLTVQTVNVTITITNDCAPATEVSINQEIQIYPATQKAKVAFIITGKEGGGFDEYTNDDKTACNTLLTYLSGHYDVTCVNGYATKSPAAIADYYQDYDLLVVTDFLETGKGYTNAIGTLIDKKPILSFEAYVANLSNWHIQSNPTDPSPKVKRMYVLCNGHAIFKDEGSVDIVDAKDSVTVLSALSSAGSAKGLQGFVINEAPDFLFIATVKDAANNRDLVVCCERQKVFPARLMLFGVNFYEMANLSDAGRIIIRQMMDYLLLTDEKEVSDCSLVFDNGNDGAVIDGGDGKWSNPKNWWPTYSRVPSQFQPTRIIRPCTVDQEDAHAGSVKINVGEDHSHNPYTGKITIAPTGGLTVAGAINKVKDTRWATLLETDEEDIEIKSDADHNGALVFGNKETNVRATVQYYSRAFGAPTTPTWQYMGIPTQAGQTAIEMYYAAWMCRWESSGSLGGLWQWVANEDVLQPFEGYCITQAAAKTYTLAGNLNEPKERTLALDIRDGDGFAFAANSWTAPIKISQMQDDDFTNAEKSIYIYHTGTYAEWEAKKDEIINTKTSGSTVLPGQYTVIPIHSSPYIGVDSVIPAMQGFFVKTTDTGAKLKLVYNRVVYDSKYFKTSTQPMRAPSRTMELSDAPEVMVLTVVGDSLGADRVHILSRGDFSQSYEDGWDGRKVEGDAVAPKLSVVKDCGEMAVAAIETPEGQYLSFRAGEDSIYTFTFDYEGETIYLYDRLADEAAEIRTGNTYTFCATNKTAAERFLITATPPRTPTQVETVGAEPRSEKAEKIIHENKLMILYHGAVYDAQGARVTIGKEGAR